MKHPKLPPGFRHKPIDALIRAMAARPPAIKKKKRKKGAFVFRDIRSYFRPISQQQPQPQQPQPQAQQVQAQPAIQEQAYDLVVRFPTRSGALGKRGARELKLKYPHRLGREEHGYPCITFRDEDSWRYRIVYAEGACEAYVGYPNEPAWESVGGAELEGNWLSSIWVEEGYCGLGIATAMIMLLVKYHESFKVPYHGNSHDNGNLHLSGDGQPFIDRMIAKKILQPHHYDQPVPIEQGSSLSP